MIVNVQPGSNTLLGENFSDIIHEGMYDTSVHSSYFPDSYDNMNVDQKVAYEVVSVLKMYSFLQDSGDESAKSACGTKLDEYRLFCESNSLSWNSILTFASEELQIAEHDYSDGVGESYTGDLDSNKNMVQTAHDNLVDYAGSEFQDYKPPWLEHEESKSGLLADIFSKVGDFKLIDEFKNLFNTLKEVSAKYINCLLAMNDDLRKSIGREKDEATNIIENYNRSFQRKLPVVTSDDAADDYDMDIG